MKFIVAILDTMYDWRGQTSGAGLRQAPCYFRINPDNHTGKRLYDLIGPGNLLIVTNACKELGMKPTDHGTPDPKWLMKNLTLLSSMRSIDILLVCGKVAQKTWIEVKVMPSIRTWCNPHMKEIVIPHPAARVVWTREYINEVKQRIRGEIK